MSSVCGLGGWLSQYAVSMAGEQHFETFITKNDIAVIAGWGADHIRLPADCKIIDNMGEAEPFNETNLEFIDSCISWCKQYGLRVVLDLHKAPGQLYGEAIRNIDKQRIILIGSNDSNSVLTLQQRIGEGALRELNPPGTIILCGEVLRASPPTRSFRAGTLSTS